MKRFALIGLAMLLLAWKENQDAHAAHTCEKQRAAREHEEHEQRWLADVRAVEEWKAKGFVAIDQHECLIGGPMGPEWLN